MNGHRSFDLEEILRKKKGLSDMDSHILLYGLSRTTLKETGCAAFKSYKARAARNWCGSSCFSPTAASKIEIKIGQTPNQQDSAGGL